MGFSGGTEERDYKEDIRIDVNNLEGEWIEQPSLMLHYSSLYAEAIHSRDLKKVKVDQEYARIDSEIRKDWQKHFDSKPTEVAIKNYITLHPIYRKAEKLLINATREVNLLSGIKSSFDHRKRALENIVSLHITGFHSEPINKKRKVSSEGHKQQTSMLRKGRRATSQKTND